MRKIVPVVDGRPDVGGASFQNMRMGRTHDGRPIPQGQCEVEIIDTRERAEDRLRRVAEALKDHEGRITQLERAVIGVRP